MLESVFPARPLGIQDTLCWRRVIYSWIKIFLSSPASVRVTRRRHTHCSRRVQRCTRKTADLSRKRLFSLFSSSSKLWLSWNQLVGGRGGQRLHRRKREERERSLGEGGEIPAGQINNQADLRGCSQSRTKTLKCSEWLLWNTLKKLKQSSES